MRNEYENTDPIWYDGKGINEVEFARYFREKYPLMYVDGRFYDMDGQIDNEELEMKILREIEPYVSRSIAKKVQTLRDSLKYYTRTEGLPLHEDRIHFKNGTYYLDGRFIPEKEFCANRFPIEYKADAGIPICWLSFLEQLLEKEDILTLQEFVGYSMIPTTRAQAMIMIIGNGGEGKSRIGVVLSRIFGRNMNSCPIHKLASDRFAPIEQMGKLLMIDDDLNMSALSDTGILKQIITAEGAMTLEAKNKQAVQGQLYVRLMAFGNGNLDALYDKSDGFYRRQILLKVKERPKGRKDDKHLSEKLLAELDGIVLWTLEGLKRLMDNDFHFTISEKTRTNMEESRRCDDNMIDFFESEGYLHYQEDVSIPTKELYEIYCEWCNDNAEKQRSEKSFSNKVKEISGRYGLTYNKNVPGYNGRKVRGYDGVCRACGANPFSD